LETKTQRDISEVVTINLFKSLFTGEDNTKETMETIEKYETSINIAKNLLKENIEIEVISRCTNLPLEKIEELKNEKS
jgi:hypothetical protein